MRQAILAAEDERFYQHGGVDYLSVLRAALANVTSGTQQGRRNHHHAGCAQLFPDPRANAYSQTARGPACIQDREQLIERRDTRTLCQPDFSRPTGLWLCGGLANLFWKAAVPSQRRRSRDAGGIAQGSIGIQPGREPETRSVTPVLCTSANARSAFHQRCAIQAGPGSAPGRPADAQGQHGPRRIYRRNGPPGDGRGLWRGELYARPHRPHDHPQSRPGRGVRCRSPRGVRLRSAPRLSGTRGLYQPSLGRRPARGRARPRLRGHDRQRKPGRRNRPGGNACRGQGGAKRWRSGRYHRGWTQIRRSRAWRQGPFRDTHSPRRADPGQPGRQKPLADRADAPGRGRVRVATAQRRNDLFAGRRIRFRPQQIQPCNPGISTTRVRVQAVHLFRRAGKGLQPGNGRQRRAAIFRFGPDRRRRMGAEKLRWQVRGADAVAQRADALEESGDGAGDAGDRTEVCPGLHRAFRL